MAFRDVATLELSTLVDRLAVAADAEAEARAQRVHDEADESLRQLQNEVEAEARRARSEADARVDSLHQELTQAAQQLESLRTELERDARQLDALRTEHERNAQDHEAAAARDAAAKAALATDLARARAELDAAHVESAAIREQLDAEAADRSRLLVALTDAQTDLQALDSRRQSELAASARDQARLITQPLDRLLTAFKALSQAGSIDDVLATLTEGLATEFPRVALFDVNGNHLEGVNQVGFDFKSDISKVVIPLTMDSLIAQSVKSGRVQGFTAAELADGSRALFGGTPVFVLVLPITVGGRIDAVIYADDSGQPPLEAVTPERRVKFAEILLWHAVPMLARLSSELKALGELREYVTLLLSEIEHVYNADVGARLKDEERRSRLQDNLQSAREIYARRVETEGPAAAALLDQQLAGVITAKNGTSFARELAAVAGRAQLKPQRVRTHRTAEAS